MRVHCPHCGGLAVITTRNKQTETVSDLYCQCKAVTCGAVFVCQLWTKHTIRPPLNALAKAAELEKDFLSKCP
ncbi:ogr/Delta-like zinc finger family protein [Methylomagnum sp.]